MALRPRCTCLLAMFAALLVVASAAQASNGGLQAAVIKDKIYKAAYDYVDCQANYLVEPSTTAEVAQAVQYYVKQAAARGLPLKIRASRKKFHSTTNFVCPYQQRSEVQSVVPQYLTVAILHNKMNTVLKVDAKKKQMTVGAGMKLEELYEAATKYNMSIVPGTFPVYAGLTLGGILTTGAHGSGDNATSNVCDVMVSFTMVDGQGNTRTFSRISEEGLGVCGGLGLMGIVTEMTLQMTPPTHTKLVTRYLAGDEDLANDIEKMLKVSPHMLVFWRPDLRVYSSYMVKPVATSVPATTDHMMLIPSYEGKQPLAQLMATVQEDIYDQYFIKGLQEGFMCPVTAWNSVAQTWAITEDKKPVLYTVGKTNAMASCECGDHCAWNGPENNGTAEDVHMAIEHDQLEDWLTDVKHIFRTELWETPADENRCMGPGYMWLRFGHNTTDYLGMTHNMKRPVYIQSTWLRSKAKPDYPMRFGYVLDLIEELSLCKYKARPHWGKNFPRTFSHPKCPLRDRFKNIDKAVALQKKYDPKQVFRPELWERVLGRKDAQYYPRCALDKECYCKNNSHCPKGHACMPSNAFPEYLVCKPDYDGAGIVRNTLAPLPNPLLEPFLGH